MLTPDPQLKAGASPPDFQKLARIQAGMTAAAEIRANGGLPDHIDAVAAPVSCEIAGVTLFCYPIATYCALRLINPWLNKILQQAARLQAASATNNPAATFEVPVEAMLAQVFAFAKPTEAYFRARNGEADYLANAFLWFDKCLTRWEEAPADSSHPPDRWERLGQCYRFVLEQTGLLDAVNPQPPEPVNPPATPATTAETPPASTSPPEATPASSPLSSTG